MPQVIFRGVRGFWDAITFRNSSLVLGSMVNIVVFLTTGPLLLQFRNAARPFNSNAASSLDAGVTFPNTPYLIFVGRLAVVGIERRGQGAGGPSELRAFFRVPTFQNSVK